MSIKINYKNISSKKSLKNLVLFTDGKFNLLPLKKYISKLEFSYVNDLLKTSDNSKNLFVFELSSKNKIILISIKKDITSSDIENLGAEFYGRVNYGRNIEYFINSNSIIGKKQNLLGHFLQEILFLSQEIFYTQMNMQKD